MVGWATHEKVAEDAAGIETAGVGKTDFLLNHCECVCVVECVEVKERESEQPNGSTTLLGRENPAVTHIGLAISIRQLDTVRGSDQRRRPLTADVTGKR